MADNMADNEEEYDRCVDCKELTEYKKTTHIDQRAFYIEGAGQLCRKCYKKTYNE